MRNFKKAFVTSILFLLVVTLASSGIIYIFMNSEYYRCCDVKNRNALADSIDILLSGASHGMCGFNTNVFDEELNAVSYNISGIAMTWYGREELLSEELERNPVKTVIIDISFDSLCKDLTNFEGNLYLVPRLVGVKNKIAYLITKSNITEVQNLFGTYMKDGVKIATTKVLGENSTLGLSSINNVNDDNKGYIEYDGTTDQTMSDEEIMSLYNTHPLDYNYPEENLKILQNMIDMCKEKNIRVIIAVVPTSDRHIWWYCEWERFQEILQEISADNQIEYYDFNLLKERFSLFSDKDCFADYTHMSKKGSIIFSEKMCSIINSVAAGNDVSDLFYSSYDEMKADSPYMEYYLAHVNDTE